MFALQWLVWLIKTELPLKKKGLLLHHHHHCYQKKIEFLIIYKNNTKIKVSALLLTKQMMFFFFVNSRAIENSIKNLPICIKNLKKNNFIYFKHFLLLNHKTICLFTILFIFVFVFLFVKWSVFDKHLIMWSVSYL